MFPSSCIARICYQRVVAADSDNHDAMTQDPDNFSVLAQVIMSVVRIRYDVPRKYTIILEVLLYASIMVVTEMINKRPASVHQKLQIQSFRSF